MKIREKEFKYPLIQGGMGIGVSLGRLSGSVAKLGGLGTISTVGIGYREKDYYKDQLLASKRALKREVKIAREISQGNGLIGVNIMYALNDYESLVKMSVEEGVDFIVSGAGLCLNLPGLVKDENILLAPIVSSLKALKIIIKYWDKKYSKLPDFIIIEGLKAGGHLGFTREDIKDNKDLESIVKEIITYLKDKNLDIKTFVAGGIFDNKDYKKYKELGTTGVQVGTRFIVTDECDVDKRFKDFLIKAKKEDLKIIKSPVGMYARCVNTQLIEESEVSKIKKENKCIDCLKTCNKKDIDFCIEEALVSSAKGDIKNGLFFAGEVVERIDKIQSVESVVKEILGDEYEDSIYI